MTMNKIAIVILNWNGADMLRRFLPSVIARSPQADVWVVDNNSTDASVELLRSEFADVGLVLLDKNWGFADGYNNGLRRIGEQRDYEYYLLLNSDIDVEDGWLAPMLEFMDSHQEVAACQPKLLSERKRTDFEYAGAAGGFLDCLGYPFCRGRIFDTVETDCGQYDEAVPLLWASGAALMIRREDYWNAGALDGRFFAHNEEIDLCWRLNIRGRGVSCVTSSKVYHVGGGTLPKDNPWKTYLNFRNNLTMLYKNLPKSRLRSVMRWRLLLDYVAALQMLLLQRHFGDFKAVFRARRDFRRWKHNFDDDRKRIAEWRQQTDHDESGIFGDSILWQYYVKGKKTFDALNIKR